MTTPAPVQLRAYVDGVSLIGPGFENWRAAVEILRDPARYAPRATVIPSAAQLPAAERRRAGDPVRLALALGFDAIAQAEAKPADLAAVFASSGADGRICHEICEVLATQERALSPTRFHNSVHNAAAGYWGIASGATTSCNVLSAFDASFSAGMIEAMSLLLASGNKVLLLAYDCAYPEPLHSKRPIPDSFGVGLVLAPEHSPRSLAGLVVSLGNGEGERMTDSRLESLRSAIPAARGLPLLRRLAAAEKGRVAIDYLDPMVLDLEVLPCG